MVDIVKYVVVFMIPGINIHFIINIVAHTFTSTEPELQFKRFIVLLLIGFWCNDFINVDFWLQS